MSIAENTYCVSYRELEKGDIFHKDCGCMYMYKGGGYEKRSSIGKTFVHTTEIIEPCNLHEHYNKIQKTFGGYAYKLKEQGQ